MPFKAILVLNLTKAKLNGFCSLRSAMCGVGEQGLLPEGVEPGPGAPAQVHLHLQHHHQASAPSPQAGMQFSHKSLDPNAKNSQI